MSSFWWAAFAVLLAVFVQAKCESTAFPVIPSYLVECYRDDGIYHRANRMTSTFESFLDLVRKVEKSSTARNLNARELAMALLHYLKQDGMQSIQTHTKYFPNTILPFAPSGAEYFKHRLMLVRLIPRIDLNYMTVFNETLSKKEMWKNMVRRPGAYPKSLGYFVQNVIHQNQIAETVLFCILERYLVPNEFSCNLHFMLSYSIDPYKRENEKCSPLYEKSQGETTAISVSGFKLYKNIPGQYKKHKRYIDHEANLNKFRGNSRTETFSRKSWKESLTTSDDAVEQNFPKEPEKILQRKKRNLDLEKNKMSDAEEILIQQRSVAERKYSHKEKEKFTIGNQELLSERENSHDMGIKSLIHMENSEKYSGERHVKSIYTTDDKVYTGIIPGVPLSDCPVVNGVVSTPFGSLTIGTVIAGIAAGLNPEEIPPTKLSVDPAELESSSDRVKNIWATTLAGTVADVISSPALLDVNSLQILKGGWNDSFDTNWYLLSNNQFKHLIEVALRGSLDGLLLGLHVKEWTERFPGFKLSQMLETYYYCLWGKIGPKSRVKLLSEYAPDEIFRKQVYLMSLVLKKQKINVLTVLNYNLIAREAVNKVIQHIQTMDDKEKSHIGSFWRTKIENSINMMAVVDSSWGYEKLHIIFQVLRQAQVASTVGNNLTIICGKDGRILASSENSADIQSRFTKDMLLENCTRGMDLPIIFDTLDTIYRKIYYDEKTSQEINTDSKVSVFFPFESLLQDNSYAVEKSKNFRSSFPDVRLMIASSARPESFRPLVENEKDLFPISLYPLDSKLRFVEEFADGVKQSYQRLSRPSCGSYFDDQNPGTEIRVTRELSPGNTVYYRLLPQYFYTQHGKVTVTIKSKLKTPLTVCHHRETEKPNGFIPRSDVDSDYNYNKGSEYGPDFQSEAYLHSYGRQTTNSDPEGSVGCKTITSDFYSIEMNDPCAGANSLLDCHPLYISLSFPLQDTVRLICPHCRLPTNTQYEISLSGLTCYNSATAKLASPFLLSLLIFHFFKY